jgi:hypothetical protein
MQQDHKEALDEALRREIARSLRRYAELQARLIGYEIAITALIGALDRAGALPLAAAKTALDAAAVEIGASSHASEPVAVLRQLSERLQPPEMASPDRRSAATSLPGAAWPSGAVPPI